MSADGESYEARPFLKIRRAYLHNFEASRRKHFIHGLVEWMSRRSDEQCDCARLRVKTSPLRRLSCMLSPVQWTRTASCTLIAAAAS